MDKLKEKEGVVAVGLAVIHVKDYKYILGLPEWFFYSSVVVSIFIIILVVIFTNLLFNKEIKEEKK